MGWSLLEGKPVLCQDLPSQRDRVPTSQGPP
jgi:hypothetical protein